MLLIFTKMNSILVNDEWIYSDFSLTSIPPDSAKHPPHLTRWAEPQGAGAAWSSSRIIKTFLMSCLIYAALVRITFPLLVGIVNWEGRGLMMEEENYGVFFKWGHSLTSTCFVRIYIYWNIQNIKLNINPASSKQMHFKCHSDMILIWVLRK